ncbi:MAG: ferritin family protein [Planctomycetes bacterium]|nr:ferritin family protein [Planctomycetota bacterium]MBU1518075.1 ferritin family protein [Planctomycetota bacterium]MBU2458514.1 ferritin family protein [Planctomycetota bacterium]
MTVSFTASEIFEIAEQIERNGAKYYRDAATVCVDKSMRQFFLQLEEMENDHEKTFAEMRKNLEDQIDDATVFDPDNEMIYYLKAMAKSAGWEGKSTPHAEFTGHETPVQIIKTAIEAEKASINYYLGLKEFVSPQAREKVDKIIKEEMGHIVTLQKHLEQFK